MGKDDASFPLRGEVDADGASSPSGCPAATTACRPSADAAGAAPGKRYGTGKVVGHIKMQVISDFKSGTPAGNIKRATDGAVNLTTDGFGGYAPVPKAGVVKSLHAFPMKGKADVGKLLPWVHIAISNARRSFLDAYHDIKRGFLQLYLDEFCYKFNRRYCGFGLFDRLEVCACS